MKLSRKDCGYDQPQPDYAYPPDELAALSPEARAAAVAAGSGKYRRHRRRAASSIPPSTKSRPLDDPDLPPRALAAPTLDSFWPLPRMTASTRGYFLEVLRRAGHHFCFVQDAFIDEEKHPNGVRWRLVPDAPDATLVAAGRKLRGPTRDLAALGDEDDAVELYRLWGLSKPTAGTPRFLREAALAARAPFLRHLPILDLDVREDADPAVSRPAALAAAREIDAALRALGAAPAWSLSNARGGLHGDQEADPAVASPDLLLAARRFFADLARRLGIPLLSEHHDKDLRPLVVLDDTMFNRQAAGRGVLWRLAGAAKPGGDPKVPWDLAADAPAPAAEPVPLPAAVLERWLADHAAARAAEEAARLQRAAAAAAELARLAALVPPAERAARADEPSDLDLARAFADAHEPARDGSGGRGTLFSLCASLVLGFGLSDQDALDAATGWLKTRWTGTPWSPPAFLATCANARVKATEPPGAKLARARAAWRYAHQDRAPRAPRNASAAPLVGALEDADGVPFDVPLPPPGAAADREPGEDAPAPPETKKRPAALPRFPFLTRPQRDDYLAAARLFPPRSPQARHLFRNAACGRIRVDGFCASCDGPDGRRFLPCEGPACVHCASARVAATLALLAELWADHATLWRVLLPVPAGAAPAAVKALKKKARRSLGREAQKLVRFLSAPAGLLVVAPAYVALDRLGPAVHEGLAATLAAVQAHLSHRVDLVRARLAARDPAGIASLDAWLLRVVTTSASPAGRRALPWPSNADLRAFLRRRAAELHGDAPEPDGLSRCCASLRYEKATDLHSGVLLFRTLPGAFPVTFAQGFSAMLAHHAALRSKGALARAGP